MSAGSDPRHRRRRGDARRPASRCSPRRATGSPSPRTAPRASALARKGSLRRGDRGRDAARDGRPRGARGAEEARPRAGRADDHGLRLGGDGDHGHEEGRLRLRHQALQARGGAAHPRERPQAAAARRTRTASCARPSRTRAASPRSWARARGCSRSSSLISQAAPSRSTILVVGRERHRQGAGGQGRSTPTRPRRDKPFVVVNSGSLPHDLLESNLFGHVKGAFTGAVYAKKGLFELADKGTLFFDEIGNIPLETQAKLLRVMQEREFMRLGGVGHDQGRRAHRGGHQHRPAPRGRGGPLPRGPLLPPERHRDPAPAAAPAQGGHPGPRRSTSSTSTRARTARPVDGRDARRRCRS